MHDATDPSLQALVQFVLTDRLLGLREVPIPGHLTLPPAPQRPARPSSPPNPPRRGFQRPPVPVPRPAARPATTARAPEPGQQSEKGILLETLNREKVRDCTACKLCQGRTQTVFGTGDPNARLVFVGEGPGFEEDRQGIPFVGRAGQLLTKMIAAMGLRRQDVYICNVVKCRPPNNRDPEPDEIEACSPYLLEQLRIIDPEIIVTLGLPASRTLLQSSLSMGKLRGRFHDFQIPTPEGGFRTVPLMPTYHPAYLLRDASQKVKAWNDLQMVMGKMGLPVPQR